jgi:hypothetical protein
MARSGPWQAVSSGDERRSARPGSRAVNLFPFLPGQQHCRLDSPIRYRRRDVFPSPERIAYALFTHYGLDFLLRETSAESGRVLTAIEFNLAQTVGVAHPEQVRILSVRRIPALKTDHSVQMLRKHYWEVVDRETAERYWAIRPKTRSV